MSMPTFHLAPDLLVPRLCFGTMTMGEQSGPPESLRLLDAAFAAGVNFFDSAEMYPVPQRRETQGRSEELLGRWLRARRVPRDSVVVATKVAGPSGQMTWIRNGPLSLDSQNIAEAIDSSLRRLGVDYIDLYQIHWPDRYVPMFGETEYDPSHQINLLAYSPMAMGILSGKYYSDDGGPPDARMNLFRGRYSEGESRYNLQNPKLKAAVKEYTKIGSKHGISPAILAVAFVLRHPLVASAVFGAAKISQLTEVLQATRVHLSEEIIAEINEVHARYPNPCP
uniref:NADP-dependent oxidoreductase domain-containing protein n=1 Tax=Leersia perrieri TaxID=77586 RepID=A0A0D9XUP9_9ORYZ